jgi:spore coat polysaccharide biosynthesis protein SpsF
MSFKIAIVIQARIQSTRMPGKVLRLFSDGKSTLDRIVNGFIDLDLPFYVATSNLKADDQIENWCQTRGVQCFRGDELNVLNRFLLVAEQANLDGIIRICADNPFLQHKYVNDLLKLAIQNPEYDYISFKDSRQTPSILTHWGLFGELIKVSTLKKIYFQNIEFRHKEHVTSFIYENPNQFLMCLLEAPEIIYNRTDLRFTLDDENDFYNIDEMIHLLNGLEDLTALVNLVDKNIFLKQRIQNAINKHIK